MTLNKLFAIFCLLVLAACSKDDVLIDNSDNSWNLLAKVGKNFVLIEQPSGTIKNNNFLKVDAEISSSAAYGGKIYLLSKKSYSIYVFDKLSGEYLTKIDFSDKQLMPTAIAFANSTDAYVTHENSNKVSLVDIYMNKVAKQITVGTSPRGIVFCPHGYIAVANSGSNSVSIINTKTYSKERDITVGDVPTFVGASDVNELFTVVCLGRGKAENSDEVKTSGFLCVLNPASGEVKANIEIKNSITPGSEITPRGLAVTSNGMAFIPTSYALFKTNTKLSSYLLTVAKRTDYTSVTYNKIMNELVLIASDGTAFCGNHTNAEKLYDLSVPTGCESILSLK